MLCVFCVTFLQWFYFSCTKPAWIIRRSPVSDVTRLLAIPSCLFLVLEHCYMGDRHTLYGAAIKFTLYVHTHTHTGTLWVCLRKCALWIHTHTLIHTHTPINPNPIVSFSLYFIGFVISHLYLLILVFFLSAALISFQHFSFILR